MRNKNNITPKNSAEFLMAGSNNIIDARLKECIILGDGNIVGDSKNVSILGSSGNIVGAGCADITLVNSYGNVVDPGLTNVHLINTSGQSVTESNQTYQSGALVPAAVSGETLAIIYEKKIEVTSADILQLNTVPLELVGLPPTGYFTDIISAQVKTMNPDYAFAGAVYIEANTSATYQINFGSVLLFPFAESYRITTGMKEAQTDEQYLINQKLYLKSGTNPTGGTTTMTIYLTYKYTLL